jgi:hypothetical protein
MPCDRQTTNVCGVQVRQGEVPTSRSETAGNNPESNFSRGEDQRDRRIARKKRAKLIDERDPIAVFDDLVQPIDQKQSAAISQCVLHEHIECALLHPHLCALGNGEQDLLNRKTRRRSELAATDE